MDGKLSGFLLLVAVFAMGALFFGNHPSVVVTGDNVTILYTPSVGNVTFNSSVVTFKVGAGEVITGLDVGVLGMRIGEVKNLTLPPEMAYGEYNLSRVFGVPVEFFKEHHQSVPAPGTKVTLNGLDGYILGVSNGSVVIDTNPLLAGKTVNFTVKLLRISR